MRRLGQRGVEEIFPVGKLANGSVVVKFATRNDVIADWRASKQAHEEVTAHPVRVAVKHCAGRNRCNRPIWPNRYDDLGLRPLRDDRLHDLRPAQPPLLLVLRGGLAAGVFAVARVLPHVNVVFFIVVNDAL